MRPQVEHPRRVDARAGAGIHACGLHDLGRHEPSDDPLGGSPAFRLVRHSLGDGGSLGEGGFSSRVIPLKQRRAGENVHAPVVRGVRIPLVGARRDIAQQSGEYGTVHRPIGRRAEGELDLLSFFHAIIHRGPREAGALSQAVLQLGIYVAPLPHPRERQEVRRAEFPQLAEGHPLELVVIDFPDGQQRQEVRVGMREPFVRVVGLFLLIHRPFARVLDAQRRRNDEHFPQRLFVPRLQDHPPHRRIHRQAGQFTADLGQPAGLINRPELVQQRVAGPDAFRRRRVQEGKLLDVAQPERLHAQNDVRQVAALDLRLGEARAGVEVLLRKKPDAHAVTHATATALALISAALRDRLDWQTPRAALRRVAAEARQSGVDDEADAGNRQRGFGDVGRDDDLPALRRGKHALLLGVGEPAEQGHHFDF